MAKYIRAVRLPEGDLVTIDAITTVKRFDGGVGLLDLRNRMIGWVDVDPEADEAVRAKLFRKTLTFFDELINDRRRAAQPNWDYLTEHLQASTSAKSSATPAKSATDSAPAAK